MRCDGREAAGLVCNWSKITVSLSADYTNSSAVDEWSRAMKGRAALEITKRCPRAGLIVFVTVLSMAERQHPVLCINLYNVPLCDRPFEQTSLGDVSLARPISAHNAANAGRCIVIEFLSLQQSWVSDTLHLTVIKSLGITYLIFLLLHVIFVITGSYFKND